MKNVLKQLGKAVCYFGLFLLSQNLIGLIYQFIYGFRAGYESAVTGVELDQQTFMEGIMAYINEKATDIILISGCLTMLILWLFFYIRKKNLLKEANIVVFPKNYLPILIVAGIAFQIFIPFVMSFLPAEILGDYVNSFNQKFGSVDVVAVLAQVVAAPVVEEVIIRGLMLSRLRKAMPTTVAVIISSIVFGLIHGQILWMSYAFLLGILFAVVAIKTDSILSTIIIHAVFNAAGVVMSLLAVEFSMEMYMVLGIVSGLLACGATYLLMREPKGRLAEAV